MYGYAIASRHTKQLESRVRDVYRQGMEVKIQKGLMCRLTKLRNR